MVVRENKKITGTTNDKQRIASFSSVPQNSMNGTATLVFCRCICHAGKAHIDKDTLVSVAQWTSQDILGRVL